MPVRLPAVLGIVAIGLASGAADAGARRAAHRAADASAHRAAHRAADAGAHHAAAAGAHRAAGAGGAAGAEAIQAGFNLEHLLAIAHPGTPVWAPRGERLAFTRESDSAVDLWWTAPSREEPERVTFEAGREDPRAVSGFAWTRSGDGLLYVLGGNLYLHDLVGPGTDELIGDGSLAGAPVLSPSGDRVAVVRDGRPWVGSFPALEGDFVLDDGTGFSNLVWSPDGLRLAALHGDRRAVDEDTAALMGGKVGFVRHDTTPADLALFDLDDGTVVWLERGDAYASDPAFSSAGTLAWQEISHDAKDRRIAVASGPDWSPRVVVDEHEDAWWTLTYLAAGPRWSPADERFVYVSERGGQAHAWLLDVDAGEPVQLTAGAFEVEEPEWSPDGDRLLLAANRGSLTERALFLLDLGPDGTPAGDLQPISTLRGTSTFARWSPDGDRIAFLHANPFSPLDVWVQRPTPGDARQLSDTWPEEARGEDLVIPEAVRFASSDGELVPAQIFLPPDHDPSAGPLPAVVWVHGGGIRQNRFGWHPSRVYALFYGFHQHLLRRGYVVVMVDYRGSIGYGKAFRQAQYLDLGGRDLDDVLAAARYLRRVDDVEVGRIGIWGISYGGYLTMQALVQAPTAFDAGINVAGVVDWADWSVDPGGLWIDGRMESPADHPELFRQRSPIWFVERLARPLLILHGTADTPVPVLQSLRLSDALVKAGKPFEMMIYPGEQHAFVRSRTWRDAFRRSEEFFDASLR